MKPLQNALMLAYPAIQKTGSRIVTAGEIDDCCQPPMRMFSQGASPLAPQIQVHRLFITHLEATSRGNLQL